MKKNVLFLAVGLLALSGSAFADLSETFTHITPGGVVPFTDNFTLTSFDTNLGTLESITIDLATTGTANVEIINTTGVPQSFSNATVSIPLIVTGPAGTTVATTSDAGPFAGNIGSDFGPYSFPGLSTSGSATKSIAAGLFSEFESVGPVALNFNAASESGTYGGSANGGVLFGGSGDIAGVTSITYTYEATPEPALLGVLSMGLGGIFLVRRKNLKKS
jgi:hypothetical protein